MGSLTLADLLRVADVTGITATRTQSNTKDCDALTVLEYRNGQFIPAFTCPLGAFQPITEEELAELKLVAKELDDNSDAIEVEAVELPPDEAE